ncbi:MAG: aspartate aminotransferase family protein [Cellulosilyticaceae bacterium]
MSNTIETVKNCVMNTYSRFPIVIEKGEGCYIYDEAGKKYLDMCAGIAVNSLGYGNETLKKALSEQLDQLCHISNLYYTKPQAQVAQLLTTYSGLDKVFFCNSGAEANEAAIKLARKYGSLKASNKTKIITMQQSFHGRTYGALTATGQTKYQRNFTPLVDGFAYAIYNDIESLKNLMDESVCAVMLEVVQGEGGIIVGDRTYLKAVQDLCYKQDALMIVDEVQTGIGRCGKLFAYENFDIQPDIITLAKGLGAGLPIGAMLCKEKCDVFEPGDHASTFGGNPLVTTAAKIVLEQLVKDDLGKHVQIVSNYLHQKLMRLKEKHAIVEEIRGMGLMWGIKLTIPAKDVVEACLKKGMLVVAAGEHVVRVLPPLVIEKSQIDEGICIFESVLENDISI